MAIGSLPFRNLVLCAKQERRTFYVNEVYKNVYQVSGNSR
jgi:hypothetical protein